MTYKNRLGRMLDKNPFIQLSQAVYSILKDDITTLQLKPNTKLNLTGLSKEFDISRTPVREALRLLTEEHFIRQEPGKKGFFVCPVPLIQLDKFFDCRRMMEGEAAYLCALNYANIDFSYPLRLCDEFVDMTEKRDFANYPLNEMNFHRFFIEATGNPLFIKMYNVIENLLYYHAHQLKEYFIHQTDYTPSDRNHSLPMQHVSICNAIASGVPQIAQEAAVNHLRSSRHYMQFYLTQDS